MASPASSGGGSVMGASQGGREGGREGGSGFPRARSTPLRLHREEKLRVTAVAAGYAHTTLLSADGLVFGWASQDSSLRCKQVREGGQEGGRSAARMREARIVQEGSGRNVRTWRAGR